MIIKGPYGNITILPLKDDRNHEKQEEELYITLAKISYDIALNEIKHGGEGQSNTLRTQKA
jgi:hypothetical protein